MTTPYVDPDSIAVIGFGDEVPSAWFATVRDNLELFARPPGCVVQRTVSQSIPNSTPTPVEFNAVDLRDTDGFHSPTSEPSKIVIPPGLGGWYALIGFANFASSSVGRRIVRWRVNGSALGEAVTPIPDPAGGTAAQVRDEVLLSGGDFVELLVQHSAGPTLGLSSAKGVVRLVALA